MPAKIISSDAGLCLKTPGSTSNWDAYILYSRPELEEIILGVTSDLEPGWESRKMEAAAIRGQIRDDIRDAVIEEGRVIRAAVRLSRNFSGQWGVPSVASAVASPGWGPTLYDAVMSMEGGLTADRAEVSDSASRVWTGYWKRHEMGEIEARELDDIDNPRTPDPFDDAYLHPGGSENPLNWAYFKSEMPILSSLIENHEAMTLTLKKWGINLDDHAATLFSYRLG